MIETVEKQKESKMAKVYDKIMDAKYAFWYFVVMMVILIVFL